MPDISLYPNPIDTVSSTTLKKGLPVRVHEEIANGLIRTIEGIVVDVKEGSFSMNHMKKMIYNTLHPNGIAQPVDRSIVEEFPEEGNDSSRYRWGIIVPDRPVRPTPEIGKDSGNGTVLDYDGGKRKTKRNKKRKTRKYKHSRQLK